MLARLIKYCGEMVLAAFFCVLLCEVIIRIWGYSDIYMYDPIYEPFDRTDQINYVIKPNLKDALGPGKTRFNTNGIGLRSIKPGGDIPPKKEGEYRMAFLGDSVTFGHGVPTLDSFCEVVEKRMTADDSGRVKSYNYGVMAYSIMEMAATLEYRTLDSRPDLVVLAVIYDDFNLNRRCKLDRWGYLSGMGPGGRLADSVIKKWLRHVHLVYFLRDLITDPTTHHDPLIQNFPEGYAEYLDRMVALTQEKGIRFLVVLLPDTHPYNAKGLALMAELLEKKKIEYLDLTYLRDEISLDRFTCQPNDPHPSAEVHGRIGEEIAGYLSGRGIFPAF